MRTEKTKILMYKKEEIRQELKKRLQIKKAKKAQRKPVSPAPRYDDVYHEGLKYLNSLSGANNP